MGQFSFNEVRVTVQGVGSTLREAVDSLKSNIEANWAQDADYELTSSVVGRIVVNDDGSSFYQAVADVVVLFEDSE